jgi:hypothetical protein
MGGAAPVVGLSLVLAEDRAPLQALIMLAFAALTLAACGLPARVLYRADLSLSQRIGLALHSGTQLFMVVVITSIAVHAPIF